MSKNLWRTGFIALASAVVGSFATIATGYFTYANQDRELDIKMINIGLAMLSGENKGVDYEPGRKFALRILQKYTGVEIPKDEFNMWVAKGEISSEFLQSLEGYYLLNPNLSSSIGPSSKRLIEELQKSILKSE
nr:hypothetical protein [uncultured Cohaesibacter sp.]